MAGPCLKRMPVNGMCTSAIAVFVHHSMNGLLDQSGWAAGLLLLLAWIGRRRSGGGACTGGGIMLLVVLLPIVFGKRRRPVRHSRQ